MVGSRLWTKDFFAGTFMNFFLMLNYYLLVVVMAMYAMDEFGATPSQAGLISSIFVIGSLVSRLFCGGWIERIGRKKMLMAGALLGLLMSISYFITANFWLLLVIRFLHGAAYGIAATAVGTIVIDIIPKQRQGEGIGYYMLSLTLASAIGPFLGMFLESHGGFQIIFTVCAVASALSFLNGILLKVPEGVQALSREDERGADQCQKRGSFFRNFVETKALPISIICGIVYFCYSSLLSFLTPYSKEINLADAASFFFVVYSVAIFVSRPFTGKLFDKRGERVTMYPAFLTFAIGMLLLSQSYYAVVLLASAVFMGYGMGIVQSCGLAIAVKTIPPERLGIANSTFYICLDAGIGVGPFILGFFIPYTGYRGIYLGMAVVTVLCMALYAFTLKRRKSHNK